MAKVAEVFVETLVKAGVRRVYGVVGDSLNGFIDAIRGVSGIDWMMVRHEEVAAFCGRRGGGDDWGVGGLRRKLRAGESAFNQWAA